MDDQQVFDFALEVESPKRLTLVKIASWALYAFICICGAAVFWAIGQAS